jgi:hypothetical protein
MGHIRRTGSGRWQARYRDPTGRERARNFTRKLDAERFLIGIESDKLRGQWVDPEAGRIRLSEVAERWYATTVPLKPKTRSGYRSLLDSRILPYLGDLQLGQIDPVLIREWVAASTKTDCQPLEYGRLAMSSMRSSTWRWTAQ